MLGFVGEPGGDLPPEVSWQRCVVHFYRNLWTAASRGKVKEMAAMLKAVHAQEDPQAAGEKAARGLPCCRRLHAKWGSRSLRNPAITNRKLRVSR
jgi:transposase-like protein